jgi:hypothetical protein
VVDTPGVERVYLKPDPEKVLDRDVKAIKALVERPAGTHPALKEVVVVFSHLN